MEIKVFPNSQLGGILDMFTGMKAGSLEMVYGGINTYGFIKGGEVFQITAVPFLYRDYDHMRKVLNSPIFPPHLEAAEKATGVRVIAINGDTAPRELTTRDKAVKTAADFKGLKIRIAESAMVRAAMQKLGANPQVIPFADLYMALKQGVVDAQENGVIPIKNMSFFEVQKYFMPTHYIRDVETFYIGAEKWKSLAPAHQKAIREAGEEAGNLETAAHPARAGGRHQVPGDQDDDRGARSRLHPQGPGGGVRGAVRGEALAEGAPAAGARVQVGPPEGAMQNRQPTMKNRSMRFTGRLSVVGFAFRIDASRTLHD